ncbi:MAG: sulfotransferase family protein [Deltaproteobacteria bacterium]|nr:MAG: sulfotransferase family protein [Deltaproteobacteria bacterium]
MMMRMLEAGGLAPLTDGVRRADEDNPRGYYEFEPVKRLADDASWLGDARGKAVKIISALLKHLPPGLEYRVILMNRRIDEVLASQRAMLERRGRPAGEDDDRMRELFERHLADVRARLSARADTRVLEVDYAQTVADPGATAARVNEFLGGGLDEAAMAAAVDPALYRQR